LSVIGQSRDPERVFFLAAFRAWRGDCRILICLRVSQPKSACSTTLSCPLTLLRPPERQ